MNHATSIKKGHPHLRMTFLSCDDGKRSGTGMSVREHAVLQDFHGFIDDAVDVTFGDVIFEKHFETDEVGDAHQDEGKGVEIEVIADFARFDKRYQMAFVGFAEGGVIISEDVRVHEHRLPDQFVGKGIFFGIHDECFQTFPLHVMTVRQIARGFGGGFADLMFVFIQKIKVKGELAVKINIKRPGGNPGFGDDVIHRR